MSSEYDIRLESMSVEGRVYHLDNLGCTTVKITLNARDGWAPARQQLTLFIKDDRLLEMSLLFHKIAQDLAALLPDVDACYHCVPGTPDDQCAEHGFGALKIKAAASCPLCDEPSPGGEVHKVCADHEQALADAEAERERSIPVEEAAEHVESPHRWG